jgi:hypothetical protein
VINQNPSHHLRRHPEEVCAVLPVDLILTGQSKEGLVNKRRWLQRVIGAFGTQVMVGQAPEFFVDGLHQPFQRLGIAVAPGYQAFRYETRTSGIHGLLTT